MTALGKSYGFFLPKKATTNIQRILDLPQWCNDCRSIWSPLTPAIEEASERAGLVGSLPPAV